MWTAELDWGDKAAVSFGTLWFFNSTVFLKLGSRLLYFIFTARGQDTPCNLGTLLWHQPDTGGSGGNQRSGQDGASFPSLIHRIGRNVSSLHQLDKHSSVLQSFAFVDTLNSSGLSLLYVDLDIELTLERMCSSFSTCFPDFQKSVVRLWRPVNSQESGILMRKSVIELFTPVWVNGETATQRLDPIIWGFRRNCEKGGCWMFDFPWALFVIRKIYEKSSVFIQTVGPPFPSQFLQRMFLNVTESSLDNKAPRLHVLHSRPPMAV